MSFIVLQNTPTIIDLASFASTRGWTLGDGFADHEACNAGSIEVKDSVFTPVVGEEYTVTYQISNYSSGILRMSMGDSDAPDRSSNDYFTEVITATGVDPVLSFYSNGGLRVQLVTIRSNKISLDTRKKNTIAFSQPTKKWTSFFSFTSDFGVSLFKDLFTYKYGRMYKHDQATTDRNEIYGVQYKSIFKFVANANIGQPKTFLSLSYEANQLLVTTPGGVTTALGDKEQISELIDLDFLKDTLVDGVVEVKIYDVEGVFSSSFLRDTSSGGDIINGDVLKGTSITVELIQANDELLKLKNIKIHSEPSKIGSR